MTMMVCAWHNQSSSRGENDEKNLTHHRVGFIRDLSPSCRRHPPLKSYPPAQRTKTREEEDVLMYFLELNDDGGAPTMSVD